MFLFSKDLSTYGIDWDGPVPAVDNEGVIQVPKIACPLDHNGYAALTNLVNPLKASDSFGIDIYIETVTFISQQLQCTSGFLATWTFWNLVLISEMIEFKQYICERLITIL